MNSEFLTNINGDESSNLSESFCFFFLICDVLSYHKDNESSGLQLKKKNSYKDITPN